MLLMLDRGANVVIYTTPLLLALGATIDTPPQQITGVWEGSAVDVSATLDVLWRFPALHNAPPTRVRGIFSPSARRDLLAESVMWDVARWTATGEPHMKCVTPHGSMPLMRINGLYFIEAVPLPLTESSTVT